MKKVFSVLIVAVAIMAVSCVGANKPAEEAVEATEVVVEEAAACCGDSCACADSCACVEGECACPVEAAAEEAAQ